MERRYLLIEIDPIGGEWIIDRISSYYLAVKSARYLKTKYSKDNLELRYYINENEYQIIDYERRQ